jgi:diguanylate cyclase (GGDEF)-like protein/PAS domain S-box-containing protein
MFQITVWSLPPLLAILVGVGTFLQIRGKSRVPGKQPLLALLTAVIIWAAAQLISATVTELSLKLLTWRFAYVGIVLAPVMWFVFAMSYTQRQMRLSRTAINGTLIIPFITLCLVMTNGWHHAVWTDARLIHANGYVGMVVEHGPWFYVHALYSYCLLIGATSILAYALSETTSQNKPIIAVISAPLVVGAANLFYLSSWNPSPWLDLTTLGFAAAALIMNRCVLHYGLLDSLPVLRERVVEQLRDGVTVVNHQGNIIDINGSALKLFRTQRDQLQGKNICDFVQTVELKDLLGRPNKMRVGVTIDDKAFDISSSELDESDPESNVVLVFRDITELRNTENELRDARDKLGHLAHTDSLTGLHNRRFFMRRLNEETERVRRHGSSLSVLLFDLDHFKRVNDTHGHDAGDRILQAVASASNDVKRLTDVAARVGGEEFALLLPETGMDGALRMAKRLRQAVENIRMQNQRDKGISVTASIGVANIHQLSSDLDNVLKQADEALYKAKNLGRNRVCFATH